MCGLPPASVGANPGFRPCFEPKEAQGLGLGWSDPNAVNEVASGVFLLAGHTEALPHAAVYSDHTCSAFSAGGRQRSGYAV